MIYEVTGVPAGRNDLQWCFYDANAEKIGDFSGVGVTENSEGGSYAIDVNRPENAASLRCRLGTGPVRWREDFTGYSDADRARDAAISIAVAKLGKTQLVVMAPVLANGNARITRGGDYFQSEGRSLDFELDGPVVMTFRDRIASVAFIVEEHGAFAADFENIENGVLVRVELSSAQTAAFTQSSAKLFVRATLTDGRKIPLLSGLLTIEDGGE